MYFCQIALLKEWGSHNIMYKNLKSYKSNKTSYINVSKIRLIPCTFLRIKKSRGLSKTDSGFHAFCVFIQRFIIFNWDR